MNRRLVQFLLIAIPLLCGSFVLTVSAQDAKHFLWEVRGESSTMYITGSMHLLKENSIYPLPVAVDSAFARSDLVLFERNIPKHDSAVYWNRVLEKGGYEDGKSLRDVLEPKAYEFYSRVFTVAGLDMRVMKNVKPMFVLRELANAVGERFGYRKEYGLDMFLSRRADSLGIPQDGLETLDEMIASVNQIPMSIQAEILPNPFSDTESKSDNQGLDEKVDRYISSWKTGDTTGIGSNESGVFSKPEVSDALLKGRNQRWLPRLEQHLRSDKTVFVVVGAAHLVGPNGLLKSLREKGYAVRQL